MSRIPAKGRPVDLTGLRTIGELALELGVPQHILRYWETRFTQLSAVMGPGNQRHYGPNDVALARRIHQLLQEEGYTIRGVQKLLAKGDAPSTEQEANSPPYPGNVVHSGPAPPELATMFENIIAAGQTDLVSDKAASYRADGPDIGKDPDGLATAQAVAGLLGGIDVFPIMPEDALDVHDLLAKGIPGRALTALVDGLPSLRGPELFERALGMSLRTYQRRQEMPDALLSLEQGARLWKFAEILVLATEVLGSQEEAENWLERRAIGLDQRRPIDLLATPAGVKLLEEHLGRLRYGVYA